MRHAASGEQGQLLAAHDRIASDIAQNARLRRAGEAAFAIVFVGIGISHDNAETFRRAMRDSGALAHQRPRGSPAGRSAPRN
jgi:vacuolar-type H+-ATPase subunit B/Vma2